MRRSCKPVARVRAGGEGQGSGRDHTLYSTDGQGRPQGTKKQPQFNSHIPKPCSLRHRFDEDPNR